MIKLTDIQPNPNNPRFIRDDKFEKLKASIEQFPKMMALRPIVVDASGMVLGGNMRLRALQELGYDKVPGDWVKKADELTEEEKREFIIKDNPTKFTGEWDWDVLANEWDTEQLEEWGLEIPDWGADSLDYSDKNKEIDADDLEEKMTIVLEYTFDEYEKVRDALTHVAASPEQAVWLLLKLDDE